MRIVRQRFTQVGSPQNNTPIHQGNSSFQGGQANSADEGIVHTGTVLVLDDDPSILSSLERLLTTLGHVVWIFSNPEQLLARGEPLAPACLLLDNQLGEKVRGVDVHAELRQRGWEIPTVFITAHWDVRLVVEVMRAGADGFITKPYHPDELVDAVGRALRRSADSVRTSSHVQEARVKASTLTGSGLAGGRDNRRWQGGCRWLVPSDRRDRVWHRGRGCFSAAS
jgi:FixJ family two-component response regulator